MSATPPPDIEQPGAQPPRPHFLFPKWTNALLPTIIVTAIIVPIYAALIVAYGLSPETFNVGYMPVQPMPFSHNLHAGELKLDCRYCHNTVEQTAKAAVPPTQTCMTCHAQVQPQSENLKLLWESYSEGAAIPWQRVHDLPDFVYFNHSAHVTRGVGCASCHGRIDQMEVVYQVKTLSMGWCLKCHRNPEPHLRPLDQITNLAYDPLTEQTPDQQRSLRAAWHIKPSEDCSTCHR